VKDENNNAYGRYLIYRQERVCGGERETEKERERENENLKYM
jgi:hypothetical protein